MKVVDEVGFGQIVQDLQNSANRKLTQDEQMEIRQSLGLYGNYPKVETSATWEGFVPVDAIQAQLPPNSPPIYGCIISAEEAGAFFTETFPALVMKWNNGGNLPTYEVDCDGVKNAAKIWLNSNTGTLSATFGVSSEEQYYQWMLGVGGGLVFSVIYEMDNTELTFKQMQAMTFMPGYGHKVTITDVTPGAVNKIPAEYLPDKTSGAGGAIELTITSRNEYDDRLACTISNDDWQKIQDNPGGNFVLVYTDSDAHYKTYYYPTTIEYDPSGVPIMLLGVYNERDETDAWHTLSLIVEKMG